jgi:hypothetical protein
LKRARPWILIAACIAAVALAGLPGGAGSSPLSFSKPQVLKGLSGGEPSIAVDPSGKVIYVVAPQGVPTGVNNVLTPLDTLGLINKGRYDIPTVGVAFWRSTDGGATWSRAANIGSSIGGGDSDIIVGKDHALYVADLEAAASAICTSKDYGKNFTSENALSGPIADASGMGNSCNGLSLDQAGPEDDRPWLNVGPHGELYLTYHDFVAGYPLIEVSTDRGRSWAPCGVVAPPNQPAGSNYNPLNGALVAKPVIGRDGTIYMTVTEGDQVPTPEQIQKRGPTDVISPALNRIYLAVARGGCSPTTQWENFPVFQGPDAAFFLFNQLSMDAGGDLYALASGRLHSTDKTTNVWLFRSTNGGKSWSKPIRVNQPSQKANMMAAVTGGLRSGSVAVGWFGTSTSGDPNNGKNQWRYFAATSLDGGHTFDYATVTPNVIHYGDICTDGLFCGLPGFGSNRNLLDFSSMTVNPKTGCVMIALPGDPWNRPDLANGDNDSTSSAFFSQQTGGTCLK